MSSNDLSTRTKRWALARRLALAGAALAAVATLGTLTDGPASAEGSIGKFYYPSGNQLPGVVPRPATGSAVTLQPNRESHRDQWVGMPPESGMHLMIVPVGSEPPNYSAHAPIYTFSGRGRWSGD